MIKKNKTYEYEFICPKCKFKNDIEDKYCNRCDKALIKDDMIKH